MIHLTTPLHVEDIRGLRVGDIVSITGIVFTGRDAVLPRIVSAIETNTLALFGIDLNGSIIFHTAVSIAGVGPTSSNKLEIENSIPILSKAGVKMHLGKGSLSFSTVQALNEFESVYAVIPPVTALLDNQTIKKEIIAFPELGMEAFYRLNVVNYQAIIAAANGESLYDIV